jgi:RNA recognition motif-containing protein
MQSYPQQQAKFRPTYDLFIGGLPPTASREDVIKAIGPNPYLNYYVDIKFSPQGLNKGYAFLRIKDRSTFDQLVSRKVRIMNRNLSLETTIQNKTEKLEYARKRLFLKGIPDSVSNQELASYFYTFGEIKHAYRITTSAGKHTDFGFIEFAKSDSVDLFCQSFTGVFMNDIFVKCKRHNPKDESATKIETVKPSFTVIKSKADHWYQYSRNVDASGEHSNQSPEKHNATFKNVVAEMLTNSPKEYDHGSSNIRLNVSKKCQRIYFNPP